MARPDEEGSGEFRGMLEVPQVSAGEESRIASAICDQTTYRGRRHRCLDDRHQDLGGFA